MGTWLQTNANRDKGQPPKVPRPYIPNVTCHITSCSRFQAAHLTSATVPNSRRDPGLANDGQRFPGPIYTGFPAFTTHDARSHTARPPNNKSAADGSGTASAELCGVKVRYPVSSIPTVYPAAKDPAELIGCERRRRDTETQPAGKIAKIVRRQCQRAVPGKGAAVRKIQLVRKFVEVDRRIRDQVEHAGYFVKRVEFQGASGKNDFAGIWKDIGFRQNQGAILDRGVSSVGIAGIERCGR